MTAVSVLFLAPANFTSGSHWNSIPGGNLLCGVCSHTVLCNFHAALIPQKKMAMAKIIVIQSIPADRTLKRTEVQCPRFPALSFSDAVRQADTVRVDLTSFSTLFTCCTLERRQKRSLITRIHMSNIHNSTTSLQLISAPQRPELRDWGGLFMAYLKEFLGNASSDGLIQHCWLENLLESLDNLITLSLHGLI